MTESCNNSVDERRKAYNQYRKDLYQNRKAWGLCVICGKRMKNGEVTICCSKCLEKQREYAKTRKDKISEQRRNFRKRHKEIGLCLYCNQPAATGKQLCDYHRKYYSELSVRRYKKRKENKSEQ